MEAMITVAILGILASVGIPALWNIMNNVKLKQAARETLTAMRSARYRAINEIRPFGVFARYDDKIQIFSGTDPLDATAITQEIVLPGGVSVNDIDEFTTNVQGGFVIFNPDGSADNQGAVRLVNGNMLLMEVRLQPATTARIRLRTWDPVAGEWKEKG
jgi:Tfp pilus assembly protein FimT